MSPSVPLTASTEENGTSLPQWVVVGGLTLATFTVVTSEMLLVGVLTPLAEGLGVSAGAAGTSLTITGLVSAVTASVVPRLLGNLDRRKVLATAMVVLAVGNLLTSTAGGLLVFLFSRVILAIGMGTVWGIASAVATRLVAPRNVALAVSKVASASVLGVPLGTFIGNAFGWRAAFGSLTGLALIIAVALVVVLLGSGPKHDLARQAAH